MIISFQNKKLREICEDNKSAIEHLGIEIVQSLKNRLSDFEAAKNLSEIPLGNPTEFKVDKKVYFTIDLNKKYKLIFVVNNLNLQVSEEFDWTKITRIKIIDIHNEQNTSIFT
ncbi:hypothetical protein [Chryseobacterium jejuense]|uniref:hypothetical protein n=1 Tax=Chryseobacterium jejuense TaxID=445960 RepID=UPI001AE88F64|nr:hypothetical protein [Chryseobacterium jejuense]MBP2619114.1 proteic killer suppression protein [Chryseobacterium jejuense]